MLQYNTLLREDHAGMKLSEITYESIALLVFIISIIFTVFAPAVHYIGYVFSLVLLIYGRIKYGKQLISFADKKSRAISMTLTAFFLWSAFINVFIVGDFMVWGKGASVYLEMLIGYFLAMRLFGTEDARDMFISLFVPLTTLIFCLIIIKYQVPALSPLLPKRLFMNGNTLGLYPVLAIPYIFCYAVWVWEKKYALKYFVCVASMVTLFISFASGAWLAVCLMLPMLLYYAVKNKKIKISSIFIGILACILVTVAFNYFSHGALQRRLDVELRQISSVNDMDSLTTYRATIWRVTLNLISERPIAGYGRDCFRYFYGKALKENPAFADFDKALKDQAHNMYLELAFSSGIPSLIMFMAAFFMMLNKCWKLRSHIEGKVPWYLICLILFAGQLVYGLTGDVFEARRDQAVIFWSTMGIAAVLPERSIKNDRRAAEMS